MVGQLVENVILNLKGDNIMDIRRYIQHLLWKIGTSRLYKQVLSLHCPCKKWDLYHDCDDPSLLPEKRLTKIPDNCSTYLSGNYKKDYIMKLYEKICYT